MRLLHSAYYCTAAPGPAAQALRGAVQGRAAWPVPTSACDSSCCSLCQSSGPQERSLCPAAPAASGTPRTAPLDVARPTLMHSAEGSAASVGFCSEPETRSRRERSGRRCAGGAKQAAKRSAMDAAAAPAEGAAGDADSAGSGGSGGLRQAQNHASSSNLSACTEVEEREPVPVKRVRLLRPRGGAGLGEACSGDSEALPRCSTRRARCSQIQRLITNSTTQLVGRLHVRHKLSVRHDFPYTAVSGLGMLSTCRRSYDEDKSVPQPRVSDTCAYCVTVRRRWSGCGGARSLRCAQTRRQQGLWRWQLLSGCSGTPMRGPQGASLRT